MRKFKTSKIDDEKFNQKFEEDLKEIKEKLHAEKPSDEFKQNLQAILEEELNKTSDKKERKFHFPIYAKKLAAVCACLIIFFSGCFTFADDIENVIFKIFGSTDKVVEEAIANGNYKKIDMEYVEDNGISIKVDYVVVEGDNLYIAFNIFAKEKIDEVYFVDTLIKNQNDVILFSAEGANTDTSMQYEENRIDINNTIIIYKLSEKKIKLNDLEEIKIEINKINFYRNKVNEQKGNWKFNIRL